MKKAYTLLGFSWLIFLTACPTGAQIYDTNTIMVRTFAGGGESLIVDGQGTQAMFRMPAPIVADTSGNLFVLDSPNIRKITLSGVVSTLNLPLGLDALTIDHSGTLWALGDSSTPSNLVEITSGGLVTRSVLNVQTWAAFNGAGDGLCVDSSNNLYIAGQDNKVYRYVGGNLEVFAGSGNQASVDGNWIFSSFNLPSALASDQYDNIYVWDHGSHLIRKINQNRDVVTIAGQAGVAVDTDGPAAQASFNKIISMRVDNNGNLVLACVTSIRKMSPDTNVVTIAGSFSLAGFVDGPGASARFGGAYGLCVSQGALFVSDLPNYRIRSITFNAVPELVAATNLTAAGYAQLTITSTVGGSYQVQSSRDLRVWQPEVNVLLNSSPLFWLDTNAIGATKFYRTISLPR